MFQMAKFTFKSSQVRDPNLKIGRVPRGQAYVHIVHCLPARGGLAPPEVWFEILRKRNEEQQSPS